MDKFKLIRQWEHDRNLIKGATTEAQFSKLLEEVNELYDGLRKNNTNETIDAIGDCVVVLTIMASQLGFPIEGCIDAAYDQIKDRTGRMVDGVFVKDEQESDWTEWHGGECPVDENIKVEIMLRNGYRDIDDGGSWVWQHSDSVGDIVKYRIVGEG